MKSGMRTLMKKTVSLLPFLLVTMALLLFISQRRTRNAETSQQYGWWQIQSIDTMKYSRDPSRAKLEDPTFDRMIDQQVRAIAGTGATHVAIGTPYDEEFVPMLRRWVAAARRHGLNVWFRGNFSGWERWFDYPRISREDHIRATGRFIREHPDLFRDGDIFTPCPECENGGPGDPRRTGDDQGHRKFLIELHETAVQSFEAIGKDVESGYFSMNGDVARLIMDWETTEDLGGVVVIDHYVASPKRLREDIIEIAERSGGRIILGEFGAPILDLHGAMDEAEQADWISDALSEVSGIPELIGVNYWTSVGGSTAIWESDGTAHQSVDTLSGFYRPAIAQGRITNEIGQPIGNAIVTNTYRSTISDNRGRFLLAYTQDTQELSIQATDYRQSNILIGETDEDLNIRLIRESEPLWFKVIKFLKLRLMF